MDSRARANLPDFNRMARVFDRHIYLIEPVGAAVLAHLPELNAGAHVLDVACGSGEPGLSLARRVRGLHLTGIDTAAGMLDAARTKAARDGLENARFELMSAEELRFADGSMSAVISRFGLLMFGDRAQSAREFSRVLAPGGAFSLAVWDDMSKNTLVRCVVGALRPHVPAELLAVFEQLVRAVPLELFQQAGLSNVETGPFEWHYDFPDEPTLWDFISGPSVFGHQFAALGDSAKYAVFAALTEAFAPYRTPRGDFRIPHACRLYWGRK